jgi:electron transport complex protein RnfG
MRETIKLVIVLCVLCLAWSALLGYVNAITVGPIAEIAAANASAARKDVMPSAGDEIVEQVSEDDVNRIAEQIGAPGQIASIYKATNNGEIVGYTIATTNNGFGGAVEVLTGITTDDKISGVRITSHSETPGLGAKSTDPTFYEQYSGKDANGSIAVKKGGGATETQVDAITGATITSRAVTEAVNIASKAYEVLKGE